MVMRPLARWARSVGTFLAAAILLGAAERPNILWLMTEDNAVEYLQLYNPEGGAPMPNVERLAGEGLVFNHAFSNSPVCSAARTTLITGAYGPRIGAQHHRPEFHDETKRIPLPGDLRMFPAYLRQAGYHTTNNAKEDYNAIKSPDTWNESSPEASFRGREPQQPFFHVQTFGTTHEANLHFPESDVTRETITDPGSMDLPPYFPDTELFRYTQARYLDQHRRLDEEIGVFIDKVEEDGLMENTIIFVFGDHGGVLPRSKGYLYESGLHVPLVVWFPGKWAHLMPAGPGSRLDGFVSFVDFAPTVLRLAGVEVPGEMDGRAFLGKGVNRNELEKRRRTFGYADRFDEKIDFVRSLRVGDLKYMRSFQPFTIDGLYNQYRYRMAAYREWQELHAAGALNSAQNQFFERRQPEALYDLANDPHETRNLAADPEYSEHVARLRTEMTRMMKGLPDLSFFPEHVLVGQARANPVEFGRRHRETISDYVDIANLALLDYDEAAVEIEKALRSTDPWKRYWGLIVCSTFGEDAREFVTAAKHIAREDPEPITRMRAAEFLGLIQAADPVPLIQKAAKLAETEIEAFEILNTAVLLQQLDLGYRFHFKREWFQPEWMELPIHNVARRLTYFEEQR